MRASFKPILIASALAAVLFGGLALASDPQYCNAPVQTSVSVGTTALAVPAATLASRRSITVCSSPENTGAPLAKCALGFTPVMGVGNPGDVLRVGDCVSYPVGAGQTVTCIASAAATSITTLECL